MFGEICKAGALLSVGAAFVALRAGNKYDLATIFMWAAVAFSAIGGEIATAIVLDVICTYWEWHRAPWIIIVIGIFVINMKDNRQYMFHISSTVDTNHTQ